MARPREFDQDRVLRTASGLFALHGYDGTTISMICQAAGLSPTSLYNAYGSKRGIFEAAAGSIAGAAEVELETVLGIETFAGVVEALLLRAWAQGNAIDEGCVERRPTDRVGSASSDIEGVLQDRAANADELRLVEPRHLRVLCRSVALIAAGLRSGCCVDDRTEDFGLLAQLLIDGPANVSDPTVRPAASPARTVPHPAQGRRTFDVDLALDSCMRLFWAKGYDGTSVNDLAEATGVSKPSLYAAFGGKEQLFLQVLDRYQATVLSYGLEALDEPTAFGFARRMLDGAIATQRSSSGQRGCLWVVNSMQGGDDAVRIRAEVVSRMSAGRVLIRERLERGRRDGDFDPAVDVEALAASLSGVLQAIASLGAVGAAEGELDALRRGFLASWPSG